MIFFLLADIFIVCSISRALTLNQPAEQHLWVFSSQNDSCDRLQVEQAHSSFLFSLPH